MNPVAVKVTAAVAELVAELAHADELIAEQHARIEELEAEVARLQAAPSTRGVAA